jgi:hypothetical protein
MQKTRLTPKAPKALIAMCLSEQAMRDMRDMRNMLEMDVLTVMDVMERREKRAEVLALCWHALTPGEQNSFMRDIRMADQVCNALVSRQIRSAVIDWEVWNEQRLFAGQEQEYDRENSME